MAWIESHQGLAGHPKTKKLIRRLKSSGPVIVGHLHYLWWWALDFAQDGEITQYGHDDIADACEWKYDSTEFYEALIHAGFIEKKDDRYFIHDWYDYAGKLIEIRKKDAERKRNSRGKNKESSGSPADIQGTSEGVTPESIRDLDLNQDLKDKKTSSGEVYRIYQNNIGVMNSDIGDMLDDDIQTYGAQRVCEAIKEASRQGKNKLSYVEGILKRWHTDGKEPPKKQPSAAKPSYEEMSDKFARLRESEDEDGIA